MTFVEHRSLVLDKEEFIAILDDPEKQENKDILDKIKEFLFEFPGNRLVVSNYES